MKNIFPPEIINHSIEMHFYNNSKPFKLIYFAIVILVVTSIAILPFITINITSQSRGIVRTQYESSQILSATAGQVKMINIAEGQKVMAGDTLLELLTENLQEQIKLAEIQLSENQTFITDLNALISEGKTIRSARYNIEQTQYLANINEMLVEMDLLKKEFDIAEHLHKEKVIAEMEYLQKKNKYDAAASKLNVYKKQMKNGWQSEKTRLELNNIQLLSSIERLSKDCNQYLITAPISGTIGQLTGIQQGSFITPGQVFAVISPEDSLIAEAYVNPTDIGFIHLNQETYIQMDAFNYNQWGLIKGKVSSISDDVVVLNGNPFFKIRCHLPVNYLQLKTGQKGFLKKGMSLTCRFQLTKRTLFQLIFDKVDDWMNPKLNSNG